MTLQELKLISSLLDDKNYKEMKAYMDYVKTITEQGFNHEQLEQAIIDYAKLHQRIIFESTDDQEQLFSKNSNSIFYLNIKLFDPNILKKYILKTQNIGLYENNALKSIFKATQNRMAKDEKKQLIAKNFVPISEQQVFATSFNKNDSVFEQSDINLAKTLYPDAKIYIYNNKNIVNFESQIGGAFIIGKKY